MAHEIDYRLIGDDMQAVIVTLDPRETVMAEAGAMMYMQDGVTMQTTLDATGETRGFVSKLLSGAKRVLAGDSFFVTTFTNDAVKRRDVAFAAPYPGKIFPVDLKQWNGRVIAQKNSFLCAAYGVNVTLAFTKRFGAGLFGGEGFILQQLDGDGLAFLHACGALAEMKLGPGEVLRVDTGCLVAMEESVHYDIQFVPGIKNKLFGGEGLFFVELSGPGRVILQTLPFSRLADRIIAAAPRAGGRRRGEGSILGGIGDMLDGDG